MSRRRTSPTFLPKLLGALALLLVGLSASLPVAAQEAAAHDGAKAAGPKKAAGAKGKREKLPVKLTVTAPSPDPAWVLRLENNGPSAVRIAADPLLLSFELKAKKGGAKSCKVPTAMKPSSFPAARELYLLPGEFYEEKIDPRLYCFGETTDLLAEGTKLTPKYGFGPSWGASKEPYAAQGLDNPESYEPAKELVGEAFVLPGVGKPVTPAAQPGAAKPDSAKPDAAQPDTANDGAGKDGEPVDTAQPSKASAAPAPEGAAAALAGDTVDRNAPHIDIYARQLVDAGAARDVVINVRAVNEGRRQLLTVLRSRMLHFRVEELKADNTARHTTECVHQNAPHGIASEMVERVAPGRELSVPILVAEICPVGTFGRPGLYRITPVLDASMAGESLKVDPWLGKTLALQPSLVRLATARGDFHQGGPVKGPLVLPQAPPANDVHLEQRNATQPPPSAPHKSSAAPHREVPPVKPMRTGSRLSRDL